MGRKKELTEDIKNRIIMLSENGHSSAAIAGQLHLHDRTVRKIIQKFRENGSVKVKPRSGRPRKTNSRYDRQLKFLSLSDRFQSASKLAKQMEDATGVVLSASTVQRRLNQCGLKGCVAKKKPFISETNRLKRLKFAKEHIGWSVDQWKKVLWSDETKYNMRASDGVVYVWRRRGEALKADCLRGTVKHGGGNILIWGCMSAAGVGRIHRVEGIMNAAQYVDILQKSMLPSMKEHFGRRRAVFMHDNDPKHTAKVTSSWLEKQKFQVLQWPPQSPDLNPIENLWEILNQARDKKKRLKNANELWEDCKETWSSITPDVCLKLVESMPKRLAEVIKNKGGCTKY